jgi:hypothetical protein
LLACNFRGTFFVANAPSRFQSYVLLPFARRFMLLAAGIAFIVTIGAFAIGGVLYARSNYIPKAADPTPASIKTADVWDPSGFAPEISVDLAHMPRSQVHAGGIVASIASKHEFDPIKTLELATTADKEKFSIEPVSSSQNDDDQDQPSPNPKFKLLAKEALVTALAANDKTRDVPVGLVATFARPDGTKTLRTTFSLHYPGSEEEPAPPAIGPDGLPVGPAQATPADSSAAPPATQVSLAAQDIALVIDPSHGTLFFRAYTDAMELVANCSPNAEAYAATLRTQLAAVKKQLSKPTVLRFVGRVCSAWRAEELRIGRQQSENLEANAKAFAEAMEAKATSMLAMYVAGAALVAFLMFALALALLAIENHTLALRENTASNA